MKRLLTDCGIAAFIVVTLTSAPAWAQTGEINGKVTDQSSAVLPGVTVTVTQTATGLMRTVVTDGDGSYILSNLPTGPNRLQTLSLGYLSYITHVSASQVCASTMLQEDM